MAVSLGSWDDSAIIGLFNRCSWTNLLDAREPASTLRPQYSPYEFQMMLYVDLGG